MYPSHRRRRPKFFIAKFFFFALVGGAMLLLLSAVVMWLWNTILPSVTGVGHLTYLQALGLLVLSRILFGGFRFGHRPWHQRHRRKWGQWKEKWGNMSDEERAEFKERWRSYCERKR